MKYKLFFNYELIKTSQLFSYILHILWNRGVANIHKDVFKDV